MIFATLLRSTIIGCLLTGAIQAADSPTREEWNPVVQAVTAGDADAESRLAAITTRYPKWADGWVERARFALGAGKADEAWKHAREALSINLGNGEAGALAVQALTALNRPGDALKVAETFRKDRNLDKQANGKAGYVNFYAGYAAMAQSDPVKAREHLTAAMACAGPSAPADFHILDARIAIAAKDLAKAEASLARATTADPRNWDGWYELGRVRHALAEAESTTTGKRSWLNGAVNAFKTVTKVLPDDFESWLGEGRAQVALARLDILDGGDGGGLLREATAALEEAVRRKPDLVAGWVTLGEAQVRLELFPEAVESLTKARALGADQPSVLHNLAQALQKSGRAAEALEVLKNTVAASGTELVSQGMGYYRNHFYLAAIERLEDGAKHPDLANDNKLRAQVLRFIGHAWREWSDGIGSDGKPAKPGPLPHEREERLAKASDAYLRAGELGDVMAQRHYAAVETERGPGNAYAAGWKMLSWGSYFSATGWKMVLAHYGSSRAWDKPLHLGIWGLLIAVPLILWIKSLFRPKVVSAEDRQREKTVEPRPPTKRTDRGEDSSQSRKPSPAPKREVSPLTERKDRPQIPDRPARSSNPPVTKRPAVAETEEIVAPPKPRPKPK